MQEFLKKNVSNTWPFILKHDIAKKYFLFTSLISMETPQCKLEYFIRLFDIYCSQYLEIINFIDRVRKKLIEQLDMRYKTDKLNVQFRDKTVFFSLKTSHDWFYFDVSLSHMSGCHMIRWMRTTKQNMRGLTYHAEWASQSRKQL